MPAFLIPLFIQSIDICINLCYNTPSTFPRHFGIVPHLPGALAPGASPRLWPGMGDVVGGG